LSLIVKVLEEFGFENVPQTGGWRPVKCVFHGDRHASASVNPDLSAYKCHTCEISGDVYKLVMEQEGITFAEAKQRVADIAGKDVRDLPVSAERHDRRLLARPGTLGRSGRILSARHGDRWR
jgi:DNA primase